MPPHSGSLGQSSKSALRYAASLQGIRRLTSQRTDETRTLEEFASQCGATSSPLPLLRGSRHVLPHFKTLTPFCALAGLFDT
ncbi:hypothetical protein N9D23_09205 [Rubripirellula sp.]|nr:hypothetical protein [Rubripirellula sp.]